MPGEPAETGARASPVMLTRAEALTSPGLSELTPTKISRRIQVAADVAFMTRDS
jgi:hypothetical protein